MKVVKTNKMEETLEEAAERLYPIILEDDGWDKNKQYRDEWIEGVKWHAERSFSEEEVKFIISEALQSALVTVNLDGWFEQFKKK